MEGKGGEERGMQEKITKEKKESCKRGMGGMKGEKVWGLEGGRG